MAFPGIASNSAVVGLSALGSRLRSSPAVVNRECCALCAPRSSGLRRPARVSPCRQRPLVFRVSPNSPLSFRQLRRSWCIKASSEDQTGPKEEDAQASGPAKPGGGEEENPKLDASSKRSRRGDADDAPRKLPSTAAGEDSFLDFLEQLFKPRALLATALQVFFFIMFARALNFFFGITIVNGRDTSPVVSTVAYSDFVKCAAANDLQTVEIDGVYVSFSKRSDEAEMAAARRALLHHYSELEKLGKPADGSRGLVDGSAPELPRPRVYTTTRPADLTTPYDLLLKNKVEFGAPDKRGSKLLNSAFVTLLYLGLLAGFVGRLGPFKFSQGVPAGSGRRRDRKGRAGEGGGERNTILFDDVAGVDEAKEELEEIVQYLRHPDRYVRVGARPPRGVLLVGRPGTGKTLLAKAVAGEADVPFFSVSASEFVELYVGMGASRVRELFARAKKEGPAIIFIDEIDAVAKGRESRIRGVGNDEREQTLNQLLTEMDGFDTSTAVIVLAATNRHDVLDSALLRPGRFDRTVAVEPPDKAGREAILRVHVTKKGLPLAADVDLAQVATNTCNFTGADLANLVNEAALLAGRQRKTTVSKEEFSLAVERVLAGVEKKVSSLSRVEKRTVARHEVGHALVGTAVGRVLPAGGVRVQKLSIIPRSGGALGFTYNAPPGEEQHLMFRDELRGHLAIMLGGRAAEEIACGRVSTGAVDDIQRATDLAYKAVAVYGLNESVGPLSIATLAAGGAGEGGLGWPRDQVRRRRRCPEMPHDSSWCLTCMMPPSCLKHASIVLRWCCDGANAAVVHVDATPRVMLRASSVTFGCSGVPSSSPCFLIVGCAVWLGIGCTKVALGLSCRLNWALAPLFLGQHVLLLVHADVLLMCMLLCLLTCVHMCLLMRLFMRTLAHLLMHLHKQMHLPLHLLICLVMHMCLRMRFLICMVMASAGLKADGAGGGGGEGDGGRRAGRGARRHHRQHGRPRGAGRRAGSRGAVGRAGAAQVAGGRARAARAGGVHPGATGDARASRRGGRGEGSPAVRIFIAGRREEGEVTAGGGPAISTASEQLFLLMYA
eukprot:jgi/Mesvir1/29672/Mv21511-RA.1